MHYDFREFQVLSPSFFELEEGGEVLFKISVKPMDRAQLVLKEPEIVSDYGITMISRNGKENINPHYAP